MTNGYYVNKPNDDIVVYEIIRIININHRSIYFYAKVPIHNNPLQ